MPESDPLNILLSFDRWATARMLDACGKLTDEQFHHRFDMGPGSLHDTVTHIVGAMRAWTQTLTGQPPQPRIDTDGRRRTVAELRALLDETAPAFAAEARRLPFDAMVTRVTRDGQTIQLARGAVLMQVTTHGMHHRAQCLNMLRQLGVKPLPPSSVAEWTRLADKPA